MTRLNDTVRCHPRTMREAWQRPPARPTAIQGPYKRASRVDMWVLWACLACLPFLIWAVLHWN
jgi:hypothetical protein